MKSLSISVCITLILTLIACQKKEIFQPVYQSDSDYLKASQKYSKSREENERKHLQQWVDKQQDSLNHKFEPTSSGIWIRFIKKKNQPLAKNNDWVSYTAEIKSLSNETIYTFSEFGNKRGILGKFKEIRGIESALYKMGKDDIVEILLPSFTAYALYGDENKISANLPLVIELHLTEVKTPLK